MYTLNCNSDDGTPLSGSTALRGVEVIQLNHTKLVDFLPEFFQSAHVPGPDWSSGFATPSATIGTT